MFVFVTGVVCVSNTCCELCIAANASDLALHKMRYGLQGEFARNIHETLLTRKNNQGSEQ